MENLLDEFAQGVHSCIVVQSNKRTNACCSGLQGLLEPKLFKALSDPKRLSLLVRLTELREACTVSAIAQGSGVDLSVVSRHLAILREAGVISCQKRGKEVWCVVQTGLIAKILRDLADALDACCPSGICPPMPAAENRVPGKKGT